MRHLASIKKITAIDPIPGKDRIGLATLDGKQSFKAVDPLFLLKYNE